MAGEFPVPPRQEGATAADGEVSTAGAERTGGYAWYALGVLFFVYVLNFIDRSVVNILAESIKRDLGLYDWQIGLLGAGLPFAIFYTALGIPIARMADRYNRRNILAVCLAVWSAMTALCGLAGSFAQLLLARIGVAVGEAGGSPPSHSMISDYFAADRRATALGIYALGIPVGTMLGSLFGGWLTETFDWRQAFIIVGLPGLLVALFLRLFLREPDRGYSMQAVAARAEEPPVMAVFAALWQRRSFRYMSLGGALHALVGYGVGPYVPMMFQRIHGMAPGDIGVALFYLGFAGILGTATGGYFADRLGKRDVRWYVWLPALATLASIPFSVTFYVLPDPVTAFWIGAVPGFLGSYYLGPTFALAQGMVGPRMRALTASVLLFILNLISMGLGPLIVGATSDWMNAYTDLGVESIRWAMVGVLVFNLLSAFFYWISSRDLQADLARAKELG
ncbi:MAG: MFS transporter [Pseudomonadales bacterium]|nr:MFS transporter [Pseudomonadales bacterium]MCP5182661.1 MFS transporter [Pseudomonadales bacterium]